MKENQNFTVPLHFNQSTDGYTRTKLLLAIIARLLRILGEAPFYEHLDDEQKLFYRLADKIHDGFPHT